MPNACRSSPCIYGLLPLHGEALAPKKLLVSKSKLAMGTVYLLTYKMHLRVDVT